MNWQPFVLVNHGERAEPTRPLDTPEGVADRLRAAAFAEIQAREAFLWAAEAFTDAPEALRTTWRGLAAAEDRHLQWLLRRLTDLGSTAEARKVSDQLWHSLIACQSACEFALYMASAEERGRRAGERFQQALQKSDPVTAEIFGKIAEEEIAHIASAARFFPQEAGAVQSRANGNRNAGIYGLPARGSGASEPGR